MKSLSEFLTEASWGNAGGNRKFKIAPVIAQIWGKANESKFETFWTEFFKSLGDDEVYADSYDGWYVGNTGEHLLKCWDCVGPHGNPYEADDVWKALEKRFKIKHSKGERNDIDITKEIAKDVNIPKGGKVTIWSHSGDDMPSISVEITIDDIKDAWEKVNPTVTFDWQRPGKPGGCNDAVGRALQVDDIVAFMRRAGTGGMEVGKVISTNKRPNILTETGNVVSLDGTQVCLVQRGNLIVQ